MVLDRPQDQGVAKGRDSVPFSRVRAALEDEQETNIRMRLDHSTCELES
jgi:hypothetical protein